MKQFVFLFLCFQVFMCKAEGKSLNENFPSRCDSRNCTEDTILSGLSAFINSKINPCDDFEAFIRSALNQTRHETAAYVVVKNYFSRTIDMLQSDDSDGDAKIVKITRKLYKKCVDQENKYLEVWTEMADYLRSLGS